MMISGSLGSEGLLQIEGLPLHNGLQDELLRHCWKVKVKKQRNRSMEG